MRIKSITLAAAGLVFYFLPFIFSGSDSNFTIHDNLDNNFVRYVILAEEGKTLSINPNAEVRPIMGGMARIFLPPGWNVLALLFLIFSPIAAYLVNFILVHGVALLGMYLLLRNHFLDKESDVGLAAFTALCFALIPFYTIYGLSVAGTPLLLYAFMNLAKGKKTKYDYGIIAFFPLYSSLMLVGVFAIACILSWSVYDFLKTRTIHKDYNKGVLILIGTYLIVNAHIFYQALFSKITSHRVEFVLEEFDFVAVVDRAAAFFGDLHYHVSSPIISLFVIAVIAIALGIAMRHKNVKYLVYLIVANMLIAFIYSIFNWEILEGVWKLIPLARQFQWNRFYFLSPLIWFIALALSLQIIKDGTQPLGIDRVTRMCLGMCVLFFIWKANVEFRETTFNLFSEKKIGWSYKHFFEEELFSEIKAYINKPVDTYRVASLGMHPAVALYNGMHTIDGYLPNYPLEYKAEFRKIIAPELEKARHLKMYFDNWGSRCYLFASELSHNFTAEKQLNISLKDVRFDFTEGPAVDYILSATQIENPSLIHLNFLRSFETNNSKWKIFLYQVQNEKLADTNNITTVSISAQVKVHDMFKLFYVPEGGSNFTEENCILINVQGKDDYQKIFFHLPISVKISRLRLDIGRNTDQKLMRIKSIVFSRKNASGSVKLENLLGNQFITNVEDGYQLQVFEGKYYPYFEFDPESIRTLNQVIGEEEVKLK